ncbi:hypothetical protein ACFL00_02550 [Pseudomonadota bacterium]
MLRLTRPRIYRISNRMAGFAALILLATSLTGIGGSNPSAGSDSVLETACVATEEAPEFLPSVSSAETRNYKGFKMSLFLFRHH